MSAMSAVGGTVEPDASTKHFHDKKYAVFQRMNADQKAYREMMAE